MHRQSARRLARVRLAPGARAQAPGTPECPRRQVRLVLAKLFGDDASLKFQGLLQQVRGWGGAPRAALA